MGTRNTMEDLHNLLMEQMENLRDAKTEEDMNREVIRSKAMSDVAGKVIENSRLAVEVAKLKFDNCPIEGNEIPKYLNG